MKNEEQNNIKEEINTNKEKMSDIAMKDDEYSGDEIIEQDEIEDIENQEMKIDNFLIPNTEQIIKNENKEKDKEKNDIDKEENDENKFKDIIVEFEKTKEKIKELNNLFSTRKIKSIEKYNNKRRKSRNRI